MHRHTRTHTHIHTHTHTQVYTQATKTRRRAHTHTRIHTHTYTHTRTAKGAYNAACTRNDQCLSALCVGGLCGCKVSADCTDPINQYCRNTTTTHLCLGMRFRMFVCVGVFGCVYCLLCALLLLFFSSVSFVFLFLILVNTTHIIHTRAQPSNTMAIRVLWLATSTRVTLGTATRT